MGTLRELCKNFDIFFTGELFILDFRHMGMLGEDRREGDHEDVTEVLHDAEKEDEAPHRWLTGGPRRDVSKDHRRRDPEGKGGEVHPERLAWGQCEKQWSLHQKSRETNPRGGRGSETEGSPAVKKTPHCWSGRWSTGRENPRSQPPYIDRR